MEHIIASALRAVQEAQHEVVALLMHQSFVKMDREQQRETLGRIARFALPVDDRKGTPYPNDVAALHRDAMVEANAYARQDDMSELSQAFGNLARRADYLNALCNHARNN